MNMEKQTTMDMEPEIQQKLDGVMLRLLTMEKDEIVARIRRDQERREELHSDIQRDIDKALPSKASFRSLSEAKGDEDLDAEYIELRDKMAHMREMELAPDPVIATILPGTLRWLRSRAIVNFTGNRKDLEDLGLEVRSQAQDVFTVTGTLDQLRNLAQEPACQRLHSPRKFYPSVEQASTQAEIAAVHNPRPLNPNGFQGNNILIGIIDTALDVTHHTFRDPAGARNTRVLYYWVQSPYTVDQIGNKTLANLNTLPGQTPRAWYQGNTAGRPNFNPFNTGRLYTEAAINTALGQANPYGTGANQICCEPHYRVRWDGRIESEHGTHCAGIAAGNGRVQNLATNPVHVGAAPQATIVYVCTELLDNDMTRDPTWEDAILDGINFCIAAATFHNMPIVISVSQGNNLGPHNGASDFDQAVDNLLNSHFNRAIVIAAGNDNDMNGYHTGQIAANSTASFTVTDNNNWAMHLDIWYIGPEVDYQIWRGGVGSGWRTAGQNFNGTVNGHDIEATRGADPGGGLRNIRILFEDAQNGNNYNIDLRNNHASQTVTYHAWTGSQGWWADVSGSSQHARTLADPACGKAILTVGAARKPAPINPATGELVTDYSGAGPTLDGRIKPEIVAVGHSVVSAASDEADGWVTKSGTSMATPLVAGAIALLFDAYGRAPLNLQLNQDLIKALLIQHANRLNLNLDPAQAGYNAQQRNRYGNGRLRMIEAIDHSQPPVDVDVWVRTADDDYGRTPYIGGCFCGAPDIRVFHAGTNNQTTQIQWGTTYDVRVTVRNLGDSNAVGTTVALKYTTPHTAPSAWVNAEDVNDNKLEQTVTVNAMNQTEVLFHWHPETSEIVAPAGQTHYCLLAEVSHPADVLTYSAPTAAGGNAWSTNIKGTNNVALRNLHIQ